ncbi:rCG24297, partial [Rattus norvegicus]
MSHHTLYLSHPPSCLNIRTSKALGRHRQCPCHVATTTYDSSSRDLHSTMHIRKYLPMHTQIIKNKAF